MIKLQTIIIIQAIKRKEGDNLDPIKKKRKRIF